MSTRFIGSAGVAFALAFITSSSAAAQADGFRLNRYHAPALATDGLMLSAPDTLARRQLSVGLWLDFANDPIVLELERGTTDSEFGPIVGEQLDAHLAVAYGATDAVTLFAVLDVVTVMQGDEVLVPSSALRAELADGAGLGDARVGGRVRLLGGGQADRFGLGVEAAIVLPLAELADDDQTLRGASHVGGDIALLGDLDLEVVSLGASAGVRLRDDQVFLASEIGSELFLGAGVRIPFHDLVHAMAELHVASTLSDAFGRSATPMEMLAGLRLVPVEGLRITVGGGPGLQRGIGAPDMRLLAGLSYVTPVDRDGDRDGIEDDEDACPQQPEDRDGHQDGDGCPDPDDDGDGIADAADQCPREREDRIGNADDGCPTADRDGDGIADAADRCAAEPEDKDGFQDDDGCPEPDNDGDQIADAADACPQEPEDQDGYQDEDGCPDTDNDGDGVADAEDKCPRVPGDAEHEGCSAQVSVDENQVRITERIEFSVGKAEILPQSHDVLGAIKSVLEANADLRRLIVQGHTDAKGSEAGNRELSKRRAESIAAWLVAQGIAPERLEAWGCGASQPIADEDTADGRQKNRRVEFHIADPAPAQPADVSGCERTK